MHNSNAALSAKANIEANVVNEILAKLVCISYEPCALHYYTVTLLHGQSKGEVVYRSLSK